MVANIFGFIVSPVCELSVHHDFLLFLFFLASLTLVERLQVYGRGGNCPP